MHLVVRQRVRVGPDHVRVHQGRALPLPGPLGGLGERVVGGERIAAVHLDDLQVGEPDHQLGDGAAGGVHLDGHRDGVAVVLDEVHHRKLEIAGAVERLPELALGGGAFARRHQHNLVIVHQVGAVFNLVVLAVAKPGLGAADGLEELGPRGAGRADDVEVLVAPVGRHLTAAGVGVVGGAHRRQQLLGGRHTQAQTQRPVAIVGVEPVVGRAEYLRRGGQYGLVAGRGYLEKDLVLPLE